MHKSIAVFLLATVAALMSNELPIALGGFIENFDEAGSSPNNFVPFAADPVYTTSLGQGGSAIGNQYLNAYVVQTDPINLSITHDQSGSGYFLEDWTNGGHVSYIGKVWGTSTPVPVTSGASYIFSFYLTNDNTQFSNPAIIQPMVNGQYIGLPVIASGFFTDGNSADQWQQFSFVWNSGTATTADLSLWNQNQEMPVVGFGYGDDFGIDTISLSLNGVPEPSSVILATFGLVALASWCWTIRRFPSWIARGLTNEFERAG